MTTLISTTNGISYSETTGAGKAGLTAIANDNTTIVCNMFSDNSYSYIVEITPTEKEMAIFQNNGNPKGIKKAYRLVKTLLYKKQNNIN